MQLKVAGRHMDVTPAIRDYVEEKVGRVAKIHDSDEMLVEVVLHTEKNPSNKNRDVAEVTARMKGIVVRAEEAAPDMYAAIDLVSEKLEGQMRRYKTKLIARRDEARSAKILLAERAIVEEVGANDSEASVVRTKSIDAKPMTEDEAMLQMELLGHDFFVFRHAESDAVSVLYRRNDGDYGLLQAQ